MDSETDVKWPIKLEINLLRIISLELMEDFNFFWRVFEKYAPIPAYCDPSCMTTGTKSAATTINLWLVSCTDAAG